MRPTRLAPLALAGLLIAAPALADDGARHLPARDVPVPDTVSAPMRAVIGGPLQPTWNEHPANAQEWKALVSRFRSSPKVAARPMRTSESKDTSNVIILVPL